MEIIELRMQKLENKQQNKHKDNRKKELMKQKAEISATENRKVKQIQVLNL